MWQCYFSCDFSVIVSVIILQLLFQLFGFSVTGTAIFNIDKFYRKRTRCFITFIQLTSHTSTPHVTDIFAHSTYYILYTLYPTFGMILELIPVNVLVSFKFCDCRFFRFFVFTARAYARAVLGVVILSVCPSVRPSVTRVHCDKTK